MIEPTDSRLVFRNDIDKPIDHSTALVDHWWVFHPKRGSVFFKQHSKSRYVTPQCNRSESTAEYLRSRLYPWAELRYVPVAYIRTDDKGYYCKET